MIIIVGIPGVTRKRLQYVREQKVEYSVAVAEQAVVVNVVVHHECEGAVIQSCHQQVAYAVQEVEMVVEVDGTR